MPKIENIARGVCVINGTLLVCRNTRTGNCFLPGGHIEFGETGAEALRREIAEEMGISNIAIRRFLCANENTFTQADGHPAAEITLVYEFTWQGADPATPPPSAETHLEFLWIPLASASRVNPPELIAAIPNLLSGNGSVMI